MMTRQERKAKGLNNSTCHNTGHDWRSTATNNFRVCAREHCRAAERLDESGTWIDVTPTDEQLKKHRPLLPTTVAHTLLWEDRTLLTLGLHPRQRQIERESEVRYHRLRGRS